MVEIYRVENSNPKAQSPKLKTHRDLKKSTPSPSDPYQINITLL